MSFRILLEKENFKFSCSHFTIFSRETAERLHGHNYYVTAEFRLSDLDPDLGMAFDFNTLKPLIKEIAETLDERVLIPTRSPFLKIETGPKDIKVSHHQKTYVLPDDDVKMIDAVNVTSEELARYFANELLKRKLPRVIAITVGIQETRGQTVFYETSI